MSTNVLKEEISLAVGIGVEETYGEDFMRSEPQIIGIKQNGTDENVSPKNYGKMQKNSMVIQLIDVLVSDY